MIFKEIRVFVITIFFAFIVSLNCTKSDMNNPGNKVGRVVFVGSNATLAIGMNPNDGFVYQVKEYFRASNIDATVVNAGIRGESLEQLKGRTPKIIAHPVDHLFFELAQYGQVSSEQYARYLSQILEIYITTYPDIEIYLIGLSVNDPYFRKVVKKVTNAFSGKVFYLPFKNNKGLNTKSANEKLAEQIITELTETGVIAN